MTHFLRALPLCLVLASVGAVRSADACSITSPDTLAGSLPVDGAVDVPVDVQPILIGGIASVEVQDAAGQAVPFELVAYSQAVEVRFPEPLLPDAEYVIHVSGTYGDTGSISFSTAPAETAELIVEVEDISISGLVAREAGYWIFYCQSPTEYLCLSGSVPEGQALVVETRDQGGNPATSILARGMEGTLLGGASFYGGASASDERGGMVATDWDPTACVTLSLQGTRGGRGPSREFCPEDFVVHQLATLTQVSCDDGELSFEGEASEAPEAPDGPAPPNGPPQPNGPSQPNGPGDESVDPEASDDESNQGLNPVTEGASEGCSVRRSSSASMLLLPFLVVVVALRRVRRGT